MLSETEPRIGKDWIQVGLAVSLLLLTILIHWPFWIAKRLAKYYYSEMLPGVRLPRLTELIFEDSAFSAIVVLILPMFAAFFLFWKRNSSTSWWFGLGVFILLTIHFFCFTTAIILPALEMLPMSFK